MFAPIVEATFAIQVHIAFGILGMIVGPFALFRARRDRLHKACGYVWIICILGLAVSSIWIPSEIAVVGAFGPIHLLSLYGTWGVIEGLYHIRNGNIAKHRATMRAVWFGAMGLAGLFTLLPGRVMNRVVFGGPSEGGYIVVGVGLVALFFLWRRHLARVSH